MTATGKTVAYVIAVVLVLAALPVCGLSFLFIWGAFSPQGQTAWLSVGGVGLGVGIALIAAGVGLVVWAGQRAAAAAAQKVTLQVDLPGQVKIDALKCQSCGGALTADNIKLVAGAPMVDCPYCHTSYQLTEAPKW